MKKAKILLSSLVLGAFLSTGTALAASNEANTGGNVLFKIHDISPEKDVNGNVTNCNISVTFFNNYDKSISNTQMILSWDDEVIEEIINQEEYTKKETINRDPDADLPRYPTSKTTTPTISTTVKLPLINAHQQLSLKNKVDTDRCFLLINDMNVKVNTCSFTGENSERGCKASFVYVSPQNPQYFSDFKEISYEEDIANREKELQKNQSENDEIYNNIVSILHSIGH